MQDSSDSIPKKIFSDIQMETPNECINIFSGDIELITNGKTILLKEAKVFFLWYPKLGPRFKAEYHPTSLNDSRLFTLVDKFEIRINGTDFGKGNISKLVHDDKIILEGEMNSNVVLGDRSIKVDEVLFVLPNFRNFSGDPIETTDEQGKRLSFSGRIALEDDSYFVILDKVIKEKEKREQLQAIGGYHQMYDGQILKKKGGISYAEIVELVAKLAFFLSFINGRRCSPILLTGKHKGEVIWKDYTAYYLVPFKDVSSWPGNNPTALSELWKNFTSLWRSENEKDVLITAIHWYLEANNQSGHLEGSIVMTQMGLELLYNWHIVETKKMITGNDSESISASNKIRLLLSQMKLGNTKVPDSFSSLKELVKKSNTLIDAVDAIVYIRNSIVHSQEKKRSEMRKISPMAKFEALRLSIWYIELVLLNILKYKGKFRDRTQKNRWVNSLDDITLE